MFIFKKFFYEKYPLKIFYFTNTDKVPNKKHITNGPDKSGLLIKLASPLSNLNTAMALCFILSISIPKSKEYFYLFYLFFNLIIVEAHYHYCHRTNLNSGYKINCFIII